MHTDYRSNSGRMILLKPTKSERGEFLATLDVSIAYGHDRNAIDNHNHCEHAAPYKFSVTDDLVEILGKAHDPIVSKPIKIEGVPSTFIPSFTDVTTRSLVYQKAEQIWQTAINKSTGVNKQSWQQLRSSCNESNPAYAKVAREEYDKMLLQAIRDFRPEYY